MKDAFMKFLESLLSGIFGKVDSQEPERLSETPPVIDEPKISEPRIVVVKGVKYNSPGKFKTKSGKAKGLVVHYTVSGRTPASAVSIVKYLASRGLGCPVMDEDGVIYVPEKFNLLTDVAYHAGVSAWNGTTGISSYCVGMEICNWGSAGKSKGVKDLRTSPKNKNIFAGTYQKYTEAQEKSLINFCLWMKKNSPDFTFDWVVGHDEVATPLGRKNDPGASLSMTMPEFRKLLSKMK